FFLSPLAILCFLTAHPDGSQKCGRRRFLRKGESFFIGSSGYAQNGRKCLWKGTCFGEHESESSG
ncbi:hypothetical protein, partial [Phocaeicola plebeius]|uniref:hypothetical protein n=1 Tax=Phocaeicola plebeius TaxID=310297 RepID=UPI003AEF7466